MKKKEDKKTTEKVLEIAKRRRNFSAEDESENSANAEGMQKRVLEKESGAKSASFRKEENRRTRSGEMLRAADELRRIADEKAFAEEIRRDYIRRSNERRKFEAQWQLNRNFVSGNQYCDIVAGGTVVDSDKDYHWQERKVFNHIAPIVETRLAKLMKVRPKMSVRPATGEDSDVKTAKVAGKILDSCYNRLKLDTVIGKASIWSEITGSVFYKITWSGELGRKVGETADGEPIFEGEVAVDVCPPYEILPDSVSAADVDECRSLIHARVMSIDDIERIWGIRPEAEDAETLNLSGADYGVGGRHVSRTSESRQAVVIERYTRPTPAAPQGELAIAAGGKLLYRGILPYINGPDGAHDLPFIKQDSIAGAGCFYGSSVIERAIPVQRAYNTVKNRKHEYLNRITMGVLAVEDGSVDIDTLEDEGLSPGKIIVYRQGTAPPKLMETGRVPFDFAYEEDKLLAEFIAISGVSEIMRSSSVPSALTSGLALQLLLDQDDNRLATTAERIRDAVKKIGQYILRMYKQFAGEPRLARVVGENGEVEIVSWNNSDIGCDDVVLDTENELNTSRASRQNMIFELLRAGLLHDEAGKINSASRSKILDALGFGNLEISKEPERMHILRATRENAAALRDAVEVSEIDDHSAHIAEHTRFLLESGFDKLSKKNPLLKERIMQHIRSHKLFDSTAVELGAEVHNG